MVILKNEVISNFTTVPNNVINDERLSWKAKGLFAYFVSKPTDWVIRKSDLVKRSTDGVTSMRSARKELEEAGYLKRETKRSKEGKYDETTYTIDNYPGAGFLRTGYLGPVKAPHSNTDSSKTKSKNIYSEEFETFWLAYPRKIGKKKAATIFNSLKEKDKVIEGIGKYAHYWEETGTEPQYIPHPSTWLNQERWNDILNVKKKRKEWY